MFTPYFRIHNISASSFWAFHRNFRRSQLGVVLWSGKHDDRKWCSGVVLRQPLQFSWIQLWTRYRSLYVDFYNSRTFFLPAKNSKRVEKPFFDPRMAKVYPRTWCQFIQPLTFVLPIHLLLRIASNFWSLRLSRRTNNCLLIDGLQEKIHHFCFRAKRSIEDDIFFCKKCQFLLDSPLLPSQWWVRCRFVPDCVNAERCLPCRILCYLCSLLRCACLLFYELDFCGTKLELSFLFRLATRVRQERRVTEFELNKRKYNSSANQQSVQVWSDMSNHETGIET